MSNAPFDSQTPKKLLAGLSIDSWGRLVAGDSADPHALLGPHPVRLDGQDGVIIRVRHPDAVSAGCLLDSGEEFEFAHVERTGLLACLIPGAALPLHYRIRFRFSNGDSYETEDPYRFAPTLGPLDLHLLNEGTHRRLWRCMGARPHTMDGVAGVAFSVWAPNARRVSVVGSFCNWDGRIYPMRQLGSSGVFELFLPSLEPGALYKFEIKTAEGALRLKTDPFALFMEQPPASASRVWRSSYHWGDEAWMHARAQKNPAEEPMSLYEVHLGSWARVPEEGDRPLSYREIAPRLVEHVKSLGFTHIELLPIAEHPFAGSWGYQVSGYYAPTSRYGDPDDLRFLVDTCHQHGIGVLLDWVPAHFPKDDFALRRFDGTALYEHEDPRLGEHPDWGTLVFNFGRNEVRGFLIANALYWLDEFHFDGLRVDAVASMLYLDYSRKAGEWIPNRFGGRENLEAIDFLRQLNDTVREDQPGCVVVAEESTAWPGVTAPVTDGGLGFSFKWNMGWMHDTLHYFQKEPVHRSHHHHEITFASLYEYTERFIMPLSHDEVVHGKRSLLGKVPGDPWQKFANLRLLLAYQFTRPGKKLLFMGAELAPYDEWSHDKSLDWHLAEDPARRSFRKFLSDLGALYRQSPCLWRRDHLPEGFSWIDCGDHANSVLCYARHDGDDHLVTVLNLTPVPRDGYRIGAPQPSPYKVRLCSDAPDYGGSGYPVPQWVETEPIPYHGRTQSMELVLPPLGALVLEPQS